jgi:glutamate dehydrogenase (NAD(P)+)
MDNVGRLNTQLVVEGANIPITQEAEAELHRRHVLVIPDFIANAGGVICASVEYRGGTQTMALAAIEEKIRANTAQVLEQSVEAGMPPRQAAVALAKARVRTAMEYRRWK